MQNLVAICHNVCAYGGPNIIGDAGSPHWARGRGLLSRNTSLPTCYRAEFGCSTSNHTDVGRCNNDIHSAHARYHVIRRQ